MKKKASLLISGITTVAMLAVAVGSFAAWDQLNGDVGSALTVNTSTPVVLEVGQATVASDIKTLLPKNAVIVDGTKETKDAEKLGSFTVKLKGTTAAKKVETTCAVTVKSGDTDVSSDYEVKLKKAEDNSEIADKKLEPSESGTTYDVYVQRISEVNFENSTKASEYISEKIDVTIDVTAKAPEVTD